MHTFANHFEEDLGWTNHVESVAGLAGCTGFCGFRATGPGDDVFANLKLRTHNATLGLAYKF